MNTKKDFEKILNYAKFHGIKVSFRQKRPGEQNAAWAYPELKKITVIYSLKDSFKKLSASVLHELAHLIAYSVDKKSFNQMFQCLSLKNPNKNERKIIYLKEKSDLNLMLILHKMLGLQAVSLAYIKGQKKFDIWQYHFYMNHGRFPNQHEKKIKKMEFINYGRSK